MWKVVITLKHGKVMLFKNFKCIEMLISLEKGDFLK